MREKIDVNPCRKGGARKFKSLLLMKKLLIPTYIIIAGLVVWGFINPNGIRGAWANNMWSIDFTQQYYSITESSTLQLSPPLYHAHAELFQAKLALKQENYTLALKHITPLLPQSDPVVLSIYADLLYRTKDYPGAIKAWQEAGDISSLTNAAIDARENNQIDLVILAYKSLYAINPEIYTTPLVGELIGKQEFKDTITILQNSISDYPRSSDHAIWYSQLGSVYLALQQWTEAESAYHQAITENPEDWISWRNLGWIYYDQEKNAEKAISCFEKVIMIVPDRDSGYDDIQSIFQTEGDLTKALDWYENSLISSPDNLKLRMAYASFLRQNNEPDRAIGTYLEIISQFPEYENSYFEIARVYWEINQPTPAIKNIEKALGIAPNNVQFLLRAGIIYEQSGFIEKALGVYKAAMEIEPDNIHVRQGVERLSQP